MANRSIDADFILKSLSELCLHLDSRCCTSPGNAEASSFEAGSLSDNLSLLEIAAFHIRRDNLVAGVSMLMQLVTHVARTGEAKSKRCLMPVIERMTREITDRLAIGRTGQRGGA